MPGLTYDASALIAAESNRASTWRLHELALARGERPVIPAGVLGQVWRGGPQALLSRFIKGCRVEALDEELTRAAGVACGRSGTSDVIDASVVVGAVARGDVVVTSDVSDLQRLLDGLHARLDLLTP